MRSIVADGSEPLLLEVQGARKRLLQAGESLGGGPFSTPAGERLAVVAVEVEAGDDCATLRGEWGAACELAARDMSNITAAVECCALGAQLSTQVRKRRHPDPVYI